MFEGRIPMKFVADRYFGPGSEALIDRHMQPGRWGRRPSAADTYPLWETSFQSDLGGLRCYIQSGGYCRDIQWPLELEAAWWALKRTGGGDPEVLDEAARWLLLLQNVVDDGEMVGYWLLREDDLAAGRFERAFFSMQR